MASAVNLGSINMPKMMRHISHRSSQVRDLVFIRDAIKQKDVKTTGQSSSTEGAGSTLEGPPVSFGYEKATNTTITGGAADTVYHVKTLETTVPGLTMLQSPITSRRGKLEKTGHRISGACIFYSPSLEYIKALPNFSQYKSFSELESNDKLIDVERIVIGPNESNVATLTDGTNMGVVADWDGNTYRKVPTEVVTEGDDTGADLGFLMTFANAQPAYDVDRIQFKIKASGDQELYGIKLTGYGDRGEGNTGTMSLVWKTDSLALSSTDWYTIDLPIRNGTEWEASHDGNLLTSIIGNTVLDTIEMDNSYWNMDKLSGEASGGELRTLEILLNFELETKIKDLYLYKEAEWRVESIKEYRDEYMQISAMRVRGDRASRRRTYG